MKSLFNKSELESYERYLNNIRGEEPRLNEKLAYGIVLGYHLEKLRIIHRSFRLGVDKAIIAEIVQLTEEEVDVILRHPADIFFDI
jgi:hypothetical protein